MSGSVEAGREHRLSTLQQGSICKRQIPVNGGGNVRLTIHYSFTVIPPFIQKINSIKKKTKTKTKTPKNFIFSQVTWSSQLLKLC